MNFILYENLKKFEPATIASDIPHEREANIVSKRVAELICGPVAVRAFADRQVRQMDQAGEFEQRDRWIFFRDVPSSAKYDLLGATQPLIEKYKDRINFEIDVEQHEWWLGPL